MSAQTQIGRPHPGYGDQEEPQDGPGSATPAPGAENSPGGMSRAQAYNLYTSHFLSTWNIRTYEFAAVRLYNYMDAFRIMLIASRSFSLRPLIRIL